MFAPDPLVGAAATARLSAGRNAGRRGSKPPSFPKRAVQPLGDLLQLYPDDEDQTTSCPNGHELLAMPLRSGITALCNECGKQLSPGEQVMVCRPCNFGLCMECHSEPQDRSVDTES